jgi:Flp pilus assembly protein TadD
MRPDSAGDYDNLGNVLQAMQRVEEAVAQYEAALKLASGRFRPEIYNDLGIALARLGRRDAAVAQFREALRLQPDFPAARANLAKLLVISK